MLMVRHFQRPLHIFDAYSGGTTRTADFEPNMTAIAAHFDAPIAVTHYRHEICCACRSAGIGIKNMNSAALLCSPVKQSM